MVFASKIKSSTCAWLCVMVVMLGLGENRAWGFFGHPQPAPGVFESATLEAIGDFYDASQYDASGYAVAAKTTGKFEIVPYSGQPTPGAWPGNRGFLGSSSKVTLEPGTIIDRYGFRSGTFVSPQGTPFPMRGLPDDTLSKPFEAYRVRTALDVEGGLVAPAFGKTGLGTQYELPFSVDELIRLKVLEPVTP